MTEPIQAVEIPKPKNWIRVTDVCCHSSKQALYALPASDEAVKPVCCSCGDQGFIERPCELCGKQTTKPVVSAIPTVMEMYEMCHSRDHWMEETPAYRRRWEELHAFVASRVVEQPPAKPVVSAIPTVMDFCDAMEHIGTKRMLILSEPAKEGMARVHALVASRVVEQPPAKPVVEPVNPPFDPACGTGRFLSGLKTVVIGMPTQGEIADYLHRHARLEDMHTRQLADGILALVASRVVVQEPKPDERCVPHACMRPGDDDELVFSNPSLDPIKAIVEILIGMHLTCPALNLNIITKDKLSDLKRSLGSE